MQTQFDAIIVLGRGIDGAGNLFEDPKSRVRKAVELFNNGNAPRIIMSGQWSYRLDTAPQRTEAEALAQFAVGLGVPVDKILKEEQSKDTLGNAYFCKVNFCKPNEWRNIIVVTSIDHLKRSEYIFQKVFGTDYNIKFKLSPRVVSDEQYQKEQLHEQKSLDILKDWIGHIPAGDDAAIWNIMESHHPGYSANPKISKENLERLIHEDTILE